MGMLFQDLRYSLRQLRKSPGFTITAVLTLALGIGANTAIFTLVHGILLRSLPVADPDQLYRIGDTSECCVEGGFLNDEGDFDLFSYDLYLHLKNSAPEFEQLAAMQAGQPSFSVRRGNALGKTLRGEFVSGNYFSTLGVGAYTGRELSANDDTPASVPATVVSYRAWQTEFSADPSLVGSTITVQTKPFTVVGISPPGFFGDRVTDSPPDFWMPVTSEPYVRDAAGSNLPHENVNWLYALGRVRRGTSIAALQAKLSVALRQWLSTKPAYTDNGGTTQISRQYVVIAPGGGGIQNLQQQTSEALTTLMILSGVVLLIACANIANLLLARATARRADMAMRTALGAGRGRLVRQILSETILLSCIGGLAGVAVAYAGSHLILALAFPGATNLPIEASPSLPVLGFAFLISLVTGVVLGMAPVWLSSHAHPAEALRGINRSTRDRSSLPQKSLVVVQAALSVVLLAGAILMSKTLANLEHQNFGLVTTNRYVLHLDTDGAGYTTERLPALYRQIEDRFSALPGIRNVALAVYSPLEGDNWAECVIRQGYPAPKAGEKCNATWDRVSPHFLDAIGVPIVRGRGFGDQDTVTSQPVVIVNQAFAKRFYPNDDPLGKHFGVYSPQFSGLFEIVGVFTDFKMNDPHNPARPVFLRPMAQRITTFPRSDMNAGEAASMFIGAVLLDFREPGQNVETLVRRTLAEIDPNLTVSDFGSFDAQVAGNFNNERIIARLTCLFGILALVLASVGLYGVMSYFVARRTSEIGVRMALGSTRSGVLLMVLRGAFWQVLIGLGVGVPAALLAGHLMASQLYGVGSYDLGALFGAIAVLTLCATAAGFIPARRAASIEPMQALRSE
jgi:macrolide transport system ATP-binding/permease protein